MEEIKVTADMVAEFLERVDDEAFVLADIAVEMRISEETGFAILRYVMLNDILRLKCVWVPVKKIIIE